MVKYYYEGFFLSTYDDLFIDTFHNLLLLTDIPIKTSILLRCKLCTCITSWNTNAYLCKVCCVVSDQLWTERRLKKRRPQTLNKQKKKTTKLITKTRLPRTVKQTTVALPPLLLESIAKQMFPKVAVIVVIEEVREKVLVPLVVVVVVVVVEMPVTVTDNDTEFCFLTLFTCNVHRPSSKIS